MGSCCRSPSLHSCDDSLVKIHPELSRSHQCVLWTQLPRQHSNFTHTHTQGHAHACLIKHGNKPSDWISSPHLICHMTKRAVRHACVRLIRLKSVMFGALALSDLWTSKLDATWWKRVVTHMIHFTLLLQTPSGQWVCAAVLILKFNSESKMHLNQSNYIHLLHFMFFKYRSMISKMSIYVYKILKSHIFFLN